MQATFKKKCPSWASCGGIGIKQVFNACYHPHACGELLHANAFWPPLRLWGNANANARHFTLGLSRLPAMAIDEKGLIDLLLAHSKRFDSIDKRFNRVDAGLLKINTRLDTMESNFNHRFDMIDQRLDSIIESLNGS